jgi:fucose permease
MFCSSKLGPRYTILRLMVLILVFVIFLRSLRRLYPRRFTKWELNLTFSHSGNSIDVSLVLSHRRAMCGLIVNVRFVVRQLNQCYSGAQVGVASFTVNYIIDQNVGISASRASTLFSLCQVTFTIGRFVGVAILNFVDPALLLSFYGICCTAFAIGVSQAKGTAGIGCLFALFFFESICYPVRNFDNGTPLRLTLV